MNQRGAVMQTKAEVETVVKTYALQVKAELGDKLSSVILYGSYARGDFEVGSDVDVMILLNVPHEQINDYFNVIVDIACELESEMEHTLIISPTIQSVEIFEKYKGASGFYKNILAEGVRISA
jgi:predicted nucleotidyltransferase